MALTAGAAALLAGILMSAVGTGAHHSDINSKKRKGYYVDGNKVGDSSDLGAYFREQIYNSGDQNLIGYADSLSDSQLGSVLSSSYSEDNSNFWNQIWKRPQYDVDISSALQDLANLSGVQAFDEQRPVYSDIYKEAQAQINAENQQLLDLLNQNEMRQTDVYQQQMNDLNSSYNQFRRDTLANNYQTQATMANGLNSSLSKARQSALEAGASAGLRIASNINTVMGMQNQQTANSLTTSNNLAQQLLNKQQASAGITSNYNNMLSSNTNARINLQQGNSERISSLADTKYSGASQDYSDKERNYEDYLTSKAGSGNPWSGGYSDYNRTKTYKY